MYVMRVPLPAAEVMVEPLKSISITSPTTNRCGAAVSIVATVLATCVWITPIERLTVKSPLSKSPSVKSYVFAREITPG